MKTNDMYQGNFCLKSSPHPTTKLKDWDSTPANISYLEKWLYYLLQDDCPVAVPVAMLKGVEYKLQHMRKNFSSRLTGGVVVKKSTPPKTLAAAWKSMCANSL